MERSLSALLPVHNVQSTLAATVHRFLEVLPDLTPRFEVVIADDGSTDATIEVADELATCYPQVVAVRHAIRRGRVAAIRTGLRRSTGELVLLPDARLGFPLGEVQRLWRAADEHEIVVGRVVAPPGRKPPLGGESCSGAQHGFFLVSRRAISSIPESLVDEPAFLAELRARGSAWHEIEIVPDRTADKVPARTPRPLHAMGGQATGSERSAPTPSAIPTPGTDGGPKRPKFLARLKDFALGE